MDRIQIEKRICGNCTIRGDLWICSFTGSHKEPTTPSCFRLGFEEGVYEDKGFINQEDYNLFKEVGLR